MFLRFLAILVAIATLSACTYNISEEGFYQSGNPYRVSDQVADESYEKFSLFWWGEYAGHRSNVYLKRYNKDGRLVICGMRVRSAGLASAQEPILSSPAGQPRPDPVHPRQPTVHRKPFAVKFSPYSPLLTPKPIHTRPSPPLDPPPIMCYTLTRSFPKLECVNDCETTGSGI